MRRARVPVRALAPPAILTASAAAPQAASFVERCSFFTGCQSAASTSSLWPQRRCLSSQANQWISELRYGAEEGPVFGSFGSTFSDGALTTRQLYCKALVYASGGGRRSRDWVAGCSAMQCPNQTLLSIALQYAATEADVVVFRQHMIGKLLQGDGACRRVAPSSVASSPAAASASADAAAHAGGGGAVERSGGGQMPDRPLSSAPSSQTPSSASSASEEGRAVDKGDVRSEAVAVANGKARHDEDETARLMRRLAHQLTGGMVGGLDKRAASTASLPSSNSATTASSAHAHGRQERDAGAETAASTPAPASDALPSAPADAATPAVSREDVKAAEDCVLSAAPEICCFLYDAMMASLFHCHGDVAVVEAARRRVFGLGTVYFGMDEATLRPLWRTAEAELIVRKEKLRMLGQPWGE